MFPASGIFKQNIKICSIRCLRHNCKPLQHSCNWNIK